MDERAPICDVVIRRVLCRRRHHPRRPPLAKIRPGSIGTPQPGGADGKSRHHRRAVAVIAPDITVVATAPEIFRLGSVRRGTIDAVPVDGVDRK
jgi:hypothetical protein